MSNYRHTFFNPSFVNRTTGNLMPNDTGWQTRHVAALSRPNASERSIVTLIESWASYADDHSKRYDARIGDDSYTSEHWRDIGLSLAALLNCETGRLDCGTLSRFICETLESEGIRNV